MALDPRLALLAQPANVGQTFSSILNNIGRIQALQQQRQLFPLQLQQLQNVVHEQQLNLDALKQSLSNEQFKNQLSATAKTGVIISGLIRGGDINGAKEFLLSNREKLQSIGIPQQDIDGFVGLIEQDPQQALARADSFAQLGRQLGLTGRQAPFQKSDGVIVKKDGKLFSVSQIFDPNTGQFKTVEQRIDGDIVSKSTGLTAGEAVKIAGEKSKAQTTGKLVAEKELKPTVDAKTEAAKIAQKKAQQFFEQIPAVQEKISLYDEAIKAIQQGAETGAIARFLPNVRQAAIKLDNIQKRLGLNVIQNTTFGALSENELKFALDSALPQGLEGPELIAWLKNKKRAQEKLLNYMREAAEFLSQPGKTLNDWLQLQKARAVERENPQQTAQEIQVGQFKVRIKQ